MTSFLCEWAQSPLVSIELLSWTTVILKIWVDNHFKETLLASVGSSTCCLWLYVCSGVYFLPSSGQIPLNTTLRGRIGTMPWWLHVCVRVWDEVRERPNLTLHLRVCEIEGERVRERKLPRGLPEDSRGNGSAPSSVLLRRYMERSVCRMLSAVALARAAAREHGQLL